MLSSIPEWAEMSFRRLDASQAGPIVERVRARFADLEAEKWKVPDSPTVRSDSMRSSILFFALYSIAGIEKKEHAPKAKGAARKAKSAGRKVTEKTADLDRLNRQIAAGARKLQGLLRRRADLVSEWKLSDWAGHKSSDPIDLIVALEEAHLVATMSPRLKRQAMAVGPELYALCRACEFHSMPPLQSRVDDQSNTHRFVSWDGGRPIDWDELLSQLSTREAVKATPKRAADHAAWSSKTKSTKYSHWQLRIFGTLDALSHDGEGPLDWLTLSQLATLMEVALDADRDEITNDSVKELLKRYRGRKPTEERFALI